MNVKLIKLTKEYYSQLSAMIDEWRLDHEINQMNRSPWAIFKNDYHDFDYYLENLETKEPEDGKVPDSVYFLLDVERDILLGAVNIRHYLNDYLLQFGGHIGDGVILGILLSRLTVIEHIGNKLTKLSVACVFGQKILCVCFDAIVIFYINYAT